MMASYGKILIGNNAFEFYNDKNKRDYIQIPWNEVDYIIASVLFKGKWISRFAIVTKNNGTLTFSSRNNKKTLGIMKRYIPADRMFKSQSFIQVVRLGLKKLFRIK